MNTELYEFVREHFNEPVLFLTELGRCVGYAEDDDDCYMIVDFPFPRKRRVKISMVGVYTFFTGLKGQSGRILATGEYWDDYLRIDCELTLSQVPKLDEFVLEITEGLPTTI